MLDSILVLQQNTQQKPFKEEGFIFGSVGGYGPSLQEGMVTGGERQVGGHTAFAVSKQR